MINSTDIKVTFNARSGSQDISRTRGLNSKLHLIVDEYGLSASGAVADCNQAFLLMERLEGEAFLADKAYDTNELLDTLKEAHISAVIPPLKSRKEQRVYNHELERHVIENVFRVLKRWRGTAVCYAKLIASFITAIYVGVYSSTSQSTLPKEQLSRSHFMTFPFKTALLVSRGRLYVLVVGYSDIAHLCL